MKNQALIYALAEIRASIENGDRKQALRDLSKLEVCLKDCECPELLDSNGFPVILPAFLIEQAS